MVGGREGMASIRNANTHTFIHTHTHGGSGMNCENMLLLCCAVLFTDRQVHTVEFLEPWRNKLILLLY